MNHFYKLLRSVKPRFKQVTAGALVAVTCFMQPSFAQTTNTEEPLLYGFRGYSMNTSEETDLGLYTITVEGETSMVWPDNVIGATGTYIAVMWPMDGQLHALFGNASAYYHLSFDLETGEKRIQDRLDVSGNNAYKYIRRGAYNPKDGYIYGYSWNADETEDYFVKTPASDPSDVTIIREMPKDYVACTANCFNPEDNCMYGIDVYKSLVRVDVHGNFSYINLITPSKNNLHGVVTGMVYSPKDKCYYWNARYENYSSEFVKIDPTNTQEVEVNGYTETCIKTEHIKWFNQFDAYVSMFTFDSTGMPDGPVAPEMINFNFAEGATSGSVVYKMPTMLANGNQAPSSMKWEATAGDITKTGNAAPGQEVTVNYSNLPGGEYSFRFRAFNGDNAGELDVYTTWLGVDIPSVPTNVTFAPAANKGEYNIKWDAVTTGTHNGFINKDNMTYKVYLNGNELIATTKNTEATVKIEAGDDEISCYVVVYAIADNKASEPGYSPTIYVGNGWKLPFTIVPTTDQVQMMTYINPEGDALGWRPFMCPPDIPTFYTGNSQFYPGNDWLITPHFQFPDGDAIYEISYDVAVWNTEINKDYYDIWLGTEPTADGIMVKEILPKTQPASMMFESQSHTFRVPKAGTYYIGFRCLSDARQGGILLKNITIQQMTSVTEVAADDVNVIGGKGYITVKGGQGKSLAIYSLDGMCVYSVTSCQEEMINLRPGMYVVVCGDKKHKVVVK